MECQQHISGDNDEDVGKFVCTRCKVSANLYTRGKTVVPGQHAQEARIDRKVSHSTVDAEEVERKVWSLDHRSGLRNT